MILINVIIEMKVLQKWKLYNNASFTIMKVLQLKLLYSHYTPSLNFHCQDEVGESLCYIPGIPSASLSEHG